MRKERICPYPGLRPFNEEESIFFKGREEHIDKIISQLQEKKFLMVTGASGDGKSSIIYAGLIPRSRAGFFKTQYNNWLVVDFRPERAPLTNLASALNEHLHFSNVNDLEDELSYGFSSLIKVYKESAFYVDKNADTYINANDETKQQLKNKGANLLILADQFEELFTNAENFSNGKPSLQAITLINLIIETTKIAEQENLPVYIVCTMRSDYIGDCAAFKGLPEIIVYSQFFVPRLKRQEIHRAIIEPARLSGNKINNRLVERLINELGDGLDQLPILQHALNRIWKSHMDDEASEMDIIHYAKVGGLEGSLLPEENKKAFLEWYAQQSLYKQKILELASLTNVLNAHARELFEMSVAYCRNHIKQDISKADAQEILQKIFTCLTKINDGRAVRNRISVMEIKQIVGNNIDNSLIEGLINLYRTPENTLVKPFISDNNKATLYLKDDDVLDITHESLIRNWTELITWTKQDNENVLVINDFKKQLERWEQKERSSDYLLTAGSLSYFNTWFKSIDPNPHLIAKYDSSNNEPQQKVETATQFISSATAYLQISEATIKRKRQAAIAITAVVVMILIGFTSWAFLERNKAVVQQEIANQKTIEAKTSEKQALTSESEALKAKNAAIALKEKAEISEKIALTAKQQAEQSKQEALNAKTIAETEKKNAQEQRDVAKKEKNNAEQEKTKAEQEKAKAELAELKSRKLKLLSVAQNLALKSSLYKKNKELAGQLASQAYLFNKTNGGLADDPVIYEGLRNAYAILDSNKHAIITGTQMDTRVLVEKQNQLISADINGKIYKQNTDKSQAEPIAQVKYYSPISSLFFNSTGGDLATGHDNFNVCIWKLNQLFDTKAPNQLIEHIELKGHKGLVRAVLFSQDGKHIITGGKDSTIIIWNVQTSNATAEKSIKTKSPIKSLVYLNNEEELAVAQEDGKILIRNIKTGEEKILFKPIAAKPTCLAFNKSNNTLFAGFSDGTVKFFDLKSSDSKSQEYKTHLTAIELITFNSDYSLLATAAADKTIKIYHTHYFFQNRTSAGNSTELKNHNSKVKSIIFTSDNRLVAGCTDRTVRIWETSSEKLADKICAILKTSISESDWKTIVGEDIPYEKTCSTIH
jgi:WD40 repeat protein